MSCLQCQDLIRHTTQIFCKKSWYSVDVEHPCFRIKIKMSQITQRFLAANRQRKDKEGRKNGGKQGKEEGKKKGRKRGRKGGGSCFSLWKENFARWWNIFIWHQKHQFSAPGSLLLNGMPLCAIHAVDKERICFETSGWGHITRKWTNQEGQRCFLFLKTRCAMRERWAPEPITLNHIRENSCPHSHIATRDLTATASSWWGTGMTMMWMEHVAWVSFPFQCTLPEPGAHTSVPAKGYSYT